MNKQKVKFAVETKNGVVQRIGKSAILQPKTNYHGDGIKWYEDKPKTENK